jgi:VCBS repeat-containing protein
MRRVLIGCCISTVVILIILSGYGWVANAQGTGVIRGKVTGDGNVALANVIVRAYVKEDFMGIIQWTYAGQVTTNGTGNYTISNLNAGTYHISFNEVFPVPGYFAEFYNNAADHVSATDIPLAAGATVSNINAKLSSGAHIQGKVTDLQGNPLSGIRVVALDANNTYNTFFDTGVDGLYDIGSLQPGNYRIAFDDTRLPPIYRRQYYNNAKELAAATAVTLATDQILNNINAKLDRLGFVTGKVIDEQGNPLPSVQLTAQQRLIGLEGESWYDAQFALTDANGQYTLGGLYEGVYRVRFRDTNTLKYSTEYYDNTYDLTTATLLTITLNQTVTNINAQLALRGAITGVITNKKGNPVSGIEVVAESQLTTSPDAGWQVARIAQSNANGEYTLCCLEPGDYRIHFRDPQYHYITEYYDNVYFEEGSAPPTITLVRVTRAITTTGINAQLIEFSNLKGGITDEQNNPLAYIRTELYKYTQNENDPWRYLGSSAINFDGTYHFYNLTSGRYRMSFADITSPARYKAEFYDNAPDLLSATDIIITEELTVTINISLRSKGQVTGKVTDSNNNPVLGIGVIAYQPLSLPGTTWETLMQTTTDQHGEYRLQGFDPGVYRVGFQDYGYPPKFLNEFYDDAFTVETATDIIVTDGATITDINGQLASRGRIQGKVTNEMGELLYDGQVLVYRFNNLTNQWMWENNNYVQITAGAYAVEGLEPGLYRIGFQYPNNLYHAAYYDNVGYVENAKTITITANSLITGINAQLPANPFTWAPFAQDDQAIVMQGAMTSKLVAGIDSVLTNDRADSGASLQATALTMPTHGLLILNIDGTFSYTHNGDDATSDFFTYIANDGTQQSNVAKVTITIQPINDPPVAGNDSATVSRGQSVTVLDSGAKSLLANDSDPDSIVLTATLKTGPAHGTVTITANGAFTYTHDGSAGTSDSFTYQATDNLGASAVATVTVAINPFTFSKTVGMAGIKPLCTPVDEIHAPVGTTIVYCYTLRNLGDAPLTTHTLVDSHLGTLLTNHIHEVAPGATFSVTFTQTLTVSTTNIATWTVTSSAEQTLTEPTTSVARNAATVRIADPIDDSDGDTIPDNQEKAGDSDGDNLPNFLDTDADGDGKLDKDEVGSNPAQPVDSDQDGIPDYLDSQSAPLKLQLFLPVIQR